MRPYIPNAGGKEVLYSPPHNLRELRTRHGLAPCLTTLNRDQALRRRWIEVFTEAYSRKGVVAMVVTVIYMSDRQIYHGTLDSKIQRTTSGKKPT